MAIEGNLDYALARIHARHGQRLEEVDWRRLEANRDLGLYLAALRATSLADWVRSFDAGQDCHAFERSLRAQWRRYVETVASWHPVAVQAWLDWLAWLPGLSLLAQLAHPEPVPAWMLADPVYGPLAPGTPDERAAMAGRTVLAPLGPALFTPGAMGAAWDAHWNTLRPRLDAGTRRALERLLQTVRQHERDLEHAADSAEPLRAELMRRLLRLLRLAAGTVIVTLCHLALVALDLERLRGGLARRCLFGAAQAEQR